VAHLEGTQDAPGDLKQKSVDQRVVVLDDVDDFAEAHDRRQTFEGVGVVGVRFYPSEQGLDIGWVLANLLICHVLEAPLREDGDRIRAKFPLSGVVARLRAFDQSVEETGHFRVLENLRA